jgi:hypothetical protein
MAVPTVALNESNPTIGDEIREGPERIAEYKLQNREILEVDHVYPSSGTSETGGYHKQLTLVESADVGTGEEGICVLGAETDGDDKPELVFTDEDDVSTQITKAGALNLDAVTLSAASTLFGLIYPVGSLYCNKTDSTNPAILFGVGTWVAIESCVLVGVDSGTFATPGVEVGSETVNTSNHTHTLPKDGWGSTLAGASGLLSTDIGDGVEHAANGNTSGSSGSESLSIIQPSMPVYMWERTA